MKEGGSLHNFKIKNFIWAILLIVSLGGFFVSELHFPKIVFYFADAANIVLLGLTLRKKQCWKYAKVIIVLSIVYILTCIFGLCINYVPVTLVLWGFRNFLRGITFCFSCIVFLNQLDIIRFFIFCEKLYWLNLILSTVQYVGMGVRGDYLGGIFGTDKGCNGISIIFLNIMLAYYVAKYIYNKITLKRFLFNLIPYFFVTVFAEIKGNYIFFVLILMIEIMIGKKTWRTVGIGVAALLALVTGLYILSIVYPDSIVQLLDNEMRTKYLNAEYFGRTTFTRNALISVTNEYFFKGDILKYLFGFGMGACEVSAFFTSPFYRLYGNMHYRQYGVAMVLLQNGYLGLVLYFAMFIISGFTAIKICWNKNYDNNNKIFLLMVVGIAAFSLADSFYATLLIDMGYWIWLVLAIPYILIKDGMYNT